MAGEKRKSRFSLAVILLSVAMVVIVAFSNSELNSAGQALLALNPWWLTAALACCLGYMVMDGVGLFAFLRAQGFAIGLPSAVHLSLIGLYYANVTPGASGGQPMQAYFMNRRGIPVGVASSALAVRCFANQLATVLLAGGLFLGNRGFCASQLGGVKWPIILGYAINASVVPLILLASFCLTRMKRLVHGIIGFLGRRRWVKRPEEAAARVDRVLESYCASMRLALRRPFAMALQVLLGALQMLGLMGVTVCVYHAFGLSGAMDAQLLTVALLLFVSASYTPLPGASGAQEGGFLLYYRGMFTGGTLSVALLVWRFFTYYLFLLVGAADAIACAVRKKRCAYARLPGAPALHDMDDPSKEIA